MNGPMSLLNILILIALIVPTILAVEKYLFDSTQYQGELNWDKEAFGDSLELPGWKEQSFSQKNGDVWRVHFVCDIASSNPNNWLRLPFIDRDEANRLTIKLEYTIRECKKYPGEIRSCKETFQLFYLESDEMYQNELSFTESTYNYLKTIAPTSEQSQSLSTSAPTTQSTSNTPNVFRTEIDLSLRTNKRGVYLVFRDQGACVSLLSIKISYTLCPTQINNLAIFPKTPSGANLTDLIQKTGKCIPNSESKSTPLAYCQTNGNWFFINSKSQNSDDSNCLCKPGFYYSIQQQQCIACPQGKYKSDYSNNNDCSTCPDYSYSKSISSKQCECIDGYFRTNPNNISSQCLPYPPEPKNLTVYYIDQTSIKLRWNSIENYDKKLVQYKLECSKCIQNPLETLLVNPSKNPNTIFSCNDKIPCESYINFNPKKDDIFNNQISVSQLDSSQLYSFELYAQHLNGLFKTKTVDILVKTTDPLPSNKYITNITAYQFIDMNQIFITWSLLDNIPLNYEIRYYPRDQFDKANIITINQPVLNFTLKNSNPNVISSNIYVFQLRVRTQLGWSDYTSPIESLKISTTSYFLRSTSSNLVSYEQLKSIESRTESLTIYILIAILSSMCFVVIGLTLLVVLSRSGRIKFLSNYLNKQQNDCDSMEYAKRNAQLSYNHFAPSSGTTSSSGGSSPLWPKTYIDPHTYEDPTKVVSLFARELSPASIIIESVIGGGEFGDVCKGLLKLNTWSETIVAIKTLKGAATEQNRCDFLTEASIMAQFNDPNVIHLEGVVTQSHPLMIVTEYMENGSLDTFLRLNESKLKLPQMIKMLKDVAYGMRYLSEMNYIHRDLAARNILINKDLVCKVADFGLSREIDLDAYEYTTKGGKIPIRWTAPEACNFRKYSYASDVWSFGVLAWEVMSFGERPYWSWENKDVVRAVQEFYRLPPPDNCPDCIYKLMLRCWQDDRQLRPKFREICIILDEMENYTDELKQPPKIKELLPINPRAPTKIQMTKTRVFLNRLNLDNLAENFESCGLGNLSNLFQLESKDLVLSLNVKNVMDQKRILDELRRITESFQAHINQQSNQNSYTPFNHQTLIQEQFNVMKQQSIFNLIRNQQQLTNANDLLSFQTIPQQQTNGFLV
ncbi:unnamed protein product [Brachionus calyciflorus]|uniref:receptor protein-tyrosine kinase n=1 Tax=Brachionus calyciflorus TaxID=104777 RepID=A0A813RPJ9_9BILA|nr:unnamed protein product [Brachionus calyciflorus]